MNIRKLKAKMAERGMLLKDLVRQANIPKATACRKLNHAPETFTLREIVGIQKALGLTPEDVWAIFICPECTKSGTAVQRKPAES